MPRYEFSALLPPSSATRLSREGFVTPDGTLGIVVTGALDEKLFRGIAAIIPEGTWEFVCHPGYNDDDLKSAKTRLRASRETELRVLTMPEARELLLQQGIELISYRSLILPEPAHSAFRQFKRTALGSTYFGNIKQTLPRGYDSIRSVSEYSGWEAFIMSAPGAAPRATLDLRIRVWGMGANDHPFHQNAIAQNVSVTGACISGLEHELKVGDVIGVQYETKKARCKVIWVVEAAGLKKIQVGVQLVADQECPWISRLPAEMRSNRASFPLPTIAGSFQRHRMSFPLEFRDERVNTPMRVNATDISGNGCYVETAMPLPVSTVLRVDFWIDQEHITSSATVRTRDPGVGMGIEFTGLPEETKNRFQAHLDKLDPGISKPKAKASE